MHLKKGCNLIRIGAAEEWKKDFFIIEELLKYAVVLFELIKTLVSFLEIMDHIPEGKATCIWYIANNLMIVEIQ